MGLRLRVAKEYVQGDQSGYQLARKYNVSKASVTRWGREYGKRYCESPPLNRILEPMKEQGKFRREGEDTAAYIRRLERSLEEAQDKAYLLRRVIELSEEELGIELPKKSITTSKK
ncbi:MAG: hypothetical protein J4F31_12080 [Flavobacteriales bacterium]|nr:hypothetical protein [Flavobacteriales bacterium]